MKLFSIFKFNPHIVKFSNGKYAIKVGRYAYKDKTTNRKWTQNEFIELYCLYNTLKEAVDVFNKLLVIESATKVHP